MSVKIHPQGDWPDYLKRLRAELSVVKKLAYQQSRSGYGCRAVIAGMRVVATNITPTKVTYSVSILGTTFATVIVTTGLRPD